MRKPPALRAGRPAHVLCSPVRRQCQQADSMSSSGGVSSGGSTHRPPHPHFRILQQVLTGGDHVVGKGGINLESRGRGACGSNGCGHAGLGPLTLLQPALLQDSQQKTDRQRRALAGARTLCCRMTRARRRPPRRCSHSGEATRPQAPSHAAASTCACCSSPSVGRRAGKRAKHAPLSMHASDRQQTTEGRCLRSRWAGPGGASGGTAAAAAAAAGGIYFSPAAHCQLHRRPTCAL